MGRVQNPNALAGPWRGLPSLDHYAQVESQSLGDRVISLSHFPSPFPSLCSSSASLSPILSLSNKQTNL